MKTAYLVAAIVLTAGLVPPAVVCARSEPIDGLAALELAGAVVTLVVVCLAVGYRSSAAAGIALIVAITTWTGGMVTARFLDRRP